MLNVASFAWYIYVHIHSIATVLRLSVVCRRRLSSVTLCIVAKRCVLEQKLLLSYQGHVNRCALHLTLNISGTVRDRGLIPKDHQ